MTMWTLIGDFFVFVSGFIAAWFSKDWLIMAYAGTWGWVHKVEAKVAKVRADLNAPKN